MAIDISGSMDWDLAGKSGTMNESRMEIVKGAARHLVDILRPDETDRVAIGIVPWNQAVALSPSAAANWARNNWARYPRRRVYGVPYKCKPGGSCA